MGFFSCFNKMVLVILNFVVFAVGVAVIALASVVIHRGSHYQDMLLSGVLTLPIWTMIVGIVVTLLGFFGCCGAMKENKCMLYTYASVVTVLFIAEVTLGILIAIYPEQAKDSIKLGMKEAFKKYGMNDSSLDRTINSMQQDLDCCGVDNYKDWDDYNHEVPTSCCKKQEKCNPSNPDDIFKHGCFDAIVEDLKGVTVALGVSAIILAIIQIACICIACGLAQKRSQYV